MTGLTVQADDQKVAAQGEPVIAAGRPGTPLSVSVAVEAPWHRTHRTRPDRLDLIHGDPRPALRNSGRFGMRT